MHILSFHISNVDARQINSNYYISRNRKSFGQYLIDGCIFLLWMDFDIIKESFIKSILAFA